jgi:hypothetical protein
MGEFCNAEYTFFDPGTSRTRKPGEGDFAQGMMTSWDFVLAEQLRATRL